MEKGDGGVGGREGVTANPVFTVPFVFVFFSEQRERFKCFRSNSQTASSFFFHESLETH